MRHADHSGTDLLRARILDIVRLCEKTNAPRFIGFLDAAGAALAAAVKPESGVHTRLFGGYAQAERTVFGAFPDWAQADDEAFPICTLDLRWPQAFALSHRDVLGSLMGLGVTRQSVGDILLEQGRAVVFVRGEVAPFVLQNLTAVGRVGVEVLQTDGLPLPGPGAMKPLRATVASARLDGVLCALTGCSRSKAAQWVQAGLVAVNGLAAEKPTASVKAGDRISVRRVGKYKINDLDGRTKKGRIVLIADQYV